MATNKPRIAGYIPAHLMEHLNKFKDERNLPSMSIAVTTVLTEYFQSDRPQTDDGITLEQYKVLEKLGKIEILEERLNILSEYVEQLHSLISDAISLPKDVCNQIPHPPDDIFADLGEFTKKAVDRYYPNKSQ